VFKPRERCGSEGEIISFMLIAIIYINIYIICIDIYIYNKEIEKHANPYRKAV